VIKWPVNLRKFFLTFFNVFFSKSKKHDFLRFFEWLTTFSRTLDDSMWTCQMSVAESQRDSGMVPCRQWYVRTPEMELHSFWDFQPMKAMDTHKCVGLH